MNDLLAKLMAKKGQDSEMDPDYKDSKMAVLQQLKDEMTKMMAGDLGGAAMKKVTVAAPDSASLQAGLAKAQDLTAGDDSDEADAEGSEAPDHEHEADDAMEPAEGSEMSHPDDSSLDAMSPEEMKALLKQLMTAKQG